MPTFMKLKIRMHRQNFGGRFPYFSNGKSPHILSPIQFSQNQFANLQIWNSKLWPRKLHFFEDFGFWKGGRYFSVCDSSPLVLRAHQRQWGIVDAFSQLNPTQPRHFFIPKSLTCLKSELRESENSSQIDEQDCSNQWHFRLCWETDKSYRLWGHFARIWTWAQSWSTLKVRHLRYNVS